MEKNNIQKCIYCKSKNTIKNKTRETTSGLSIQYKCKECKKYFTMHSIEDFFDDTPYFFDGPKTLILDIETAPIEANVWKMFKEFITDEQLRKDWYMITWAAKWLDDNKVFSSKLPDFKLYSKNKESDNELLVGLWNLLDEADIVVAHNGKKFDIPKINTRFLLNGYNPPSHYRLVDTYRVVKNVFGFSKNSLNFISLAMGTGQKKETGGFELWRDCLQGKPEAWKLMEEYNIQDVEILEKDYKIIRPWMKDHPNYCVYTNGLDPRCTCGSDKVFPIDNKFYYTNLSKFQLYRCNDCGHIMRGKTNLLALSKRKNMVTNVSY